MSFFFKQNNKYHVFIEIALDVICYKCFMN